jgi:hypothetical protein
MKWEQTVASGCRWSEFAEENWKDWDFLWEDSEADYQGYAEFIAHKNGKYVHVYWTYGSCSDCDPWEDMNYEEAKKEFDDSAVYFDNFKQLKAWIDMKPKRDSNKMLEALREHEFKYELEETLK